MVDELKPRAAQAVLSLAMLVAVAGCSGTPLTPGPAEENDSTSEALDALSGAWPEDRRSPRRTGYNPFETTIDATSVAELVLAWQSPATGKHLSLGAGLLLVSSDKAGPVLALDPTNGHVVWTSSGMFAGAGAATGGVFVVPTPNGTLATLSLSTGRVLSETEPQFGAAPHTYAPLTSRGAALFVSDATFEECVAQDGGDVCVTRRTTGRFTRLALRGGPAFATDLPFVGGVPALAGGRTFLCGSDLSYFSASLAAFDAESGAQLWRSEDSLGRGGALDHAPAVSGGRVVALLGADLVVAHDERDGHRLWQRDLEPVLSGLVLTPEAVIVATGPHEGVLRLRALAPATGADLFAADLPASASHGELVATPDLVLLGVDGDLVALDRHDFSVRGRWSLGGSPGSPLVTAGRLYVGNGDEVRAFALY